MKNLKQITIALFLIVQTISFGQTKNTETISQKQDTVLKKENIKTEINTNNLKKFIGKFFLKEAGLKLEIIQEKDQMYVIGPTSKSLLIQKNETTLSEIIRGADFELIQDNENALKFTQNGYETTIERENTEPEK